MAINNEDNATATKISRPTSVAIISIFYWLFSLGSGIVGVFSLLFLFNNNSANKSEEMLSSLLLVITGIGLSVFFFSIGLGLWRLKQWARWTAIAISGLITLINLVFFVTSLVNGQVISPFLAIIHGLVLVALFSTKVKKYF